MKPIKRSVALVILNENNEFLVIQRPEDDRLSRFWGFPAASPKESETIEEAAHRAAETKLGVKVELRQPLGTRRSDRGDYTLELTDYLAKIVSGTPTVPQPDTTVTQYIDWKFTSDPTILIPSARGGSVCSRVFLDSRGVEWCETGD